MKKSTLKYAGAKNRIAEWIVSYIPEHKVYVEAFAGSAAVLLNKERCHIETINDLHGEVVNFFQILRDFPEELIQRIKLTPYAREEYLNAYTESDNDIERASKFCIRCWMGFGASVMYQNGFKTGQQSTSPNPAKGSFPPSSPRR